jgi:rhomboid protease GluP
MRWRIERYRRAAREWTERLRWLAGSTMAKQKMCPACRALVGAKDSRCPFCNERLSALNRVGLRRLFGGLMPSAPRYAVVLLAANFVLFGMALLAASRTGGGLESLFAGIPSPILVALGARDFPHMVMGEQWRLLTAVFLHANLIHLLFNSLVLFDVGPAVEEMYGSPRFLVLYVVSGISGSLVSFFWHPWSIMVGCSGALFGLIGVMIAYGYRHRTALGDQVKSMYVRWAIYGLLFGFVVPGIDNAAHIGGLVAGIAFGAIFSDTPSFSRGSIMAWRVASYTCFLAIALSFVLVGLSSRRFI